MRLNRCCTNDRTMEQQTLFQDPAVLAKTERPPILTTIARRKLNIGEPWTCCGWKRIEPDGLIIRIAQEHTLKTGKRKGKKAWRGDVLEVITTDAEMEQEELSWELQTGKCHQCGGDGKEFAGMSVAEGVRYRECHRCGGSGKAPTSL